MNKKEVKKAPALRFKGFTNDWEQRNLGDIAAFINGRAYSKNELLHQGKYKVLRVGNFYTNDSWYYSDMELDKKYYANYGDLLYTWSATFGPHIWKGEKVIYHYHIWKIILSDEITKNFTLQLLEHDKNRLLAEKNGSTMIHLTKKDMENKEIVIPSSTNEQDKVGLLLTKLDYLITLQQRKLKLLKVMKKALSQYMFCQEIEFVPILRFNSFSDKWKYERLKNLIVKEIKGKAKADMKGTKSTYIDTALLNGGSITKVDSPTDTFHNDIIILWDGSQAGKIYHGFTGALGSTLKSYKPKYSGGFLYQYLKSKEPIIFLRYRTPNIPHVVKDFTEIFKINVPSVKEQEKISKTLNYLDQSILVETKKIGSIKKIKKFLLQNMFI